MQKIHHVIRDGFLILHLAIKRKTPTYIGVQKDEV